PVAVQVRGHQGFTGNPLEPRRRGLIIRDRRTEGDRRCCQCGARPGGAPEEECGEKKQTTASKRKWPADRAPPGAHVWLLPSEGVGDETRVPARDFTQPLLCSTPGKQFPAIGSQASPWSSSPAPSTGAYRVRKALR